MTPHRSAATVTRGSLTAEQVAAHEDALTRHYGERVAPVSAYCKALTDYIDALGDAVLREQAGPFGSVEQAESIVNAARAMSFGALKSNLLYRLLYLGQPLRTRMCPEHQGRWSGCDLPGTCACQVGSDITGWLPSVERETKLRELTQLSQELEGEYS